jgi:peptide deformylase
MEIVIHPSPILRAHTTPVERVGKQERRLLKQMLKHMRRWKGIGLAAPQVACLQQLIVVEVNEQALLWANPRIIEEDGTGYMEEGCLSIPDTFVNVERAAYVWVQALNIDNHPVELKLHGLAARVVQHEIDHLNGVLIIDRGTAERR